MSDTIYTEPRGDGYLIQTREREDLYPGWVNFINSEPQNLVFFILLLPVIISLFILDIKPIKPRHGVVVYLMHMNKVVGDPDKICITKKQYIFSGNADVDTVKVAGIVAAFKQDISEWVARDERIAAAEAAEQKKKEHKAEQCHQHYETILDNLNRKQLTAGDEAGSEQR